jgi:putative Holliday junction resolvase
MRIMAIDYGDARIGLAVSDLTGLICGEAWTMQEWNMERASVRIAEEAKQRGVGTLVLGLPKNMDGTEGPRAEKSRAFKELLEKDSGLPVVLWDERRSSVEAHAILHANGKKEKKHRQTVDAVAASLILEGYLGSAAAGGR